MTPLAADALKRALAARNILPTSVLDEPDRPVAKPVRQPVIQTPVEPETMSSPVETAEAYDSRLADKFVIRLPEGMREKVKARGKADSRSMNGVVIQALAQYLDGPAVVSSSTALDELAEAVLGRITAKMGQVAIKQ
jgi:hypothetical protein